jgi:hypothetical protein
VDRRLQASGARLCTLDPRRERPSTLRSIGERLLEDSGPELQEGFAVTLERVALCQLEHFAHNLFWDFDYLAACVLRAARQAPDAASELQQLGDELCELYSLFGSRSPIRFRYVHDFVYGMDWGRWVQSDPQAHAGIGPFDRRFLRRVRARGREISGLIAAGGDAAFSPLAPGAWRNPFPFSRAPEHELRLHRELSARALIPVAGWRLDARPDWRGEHSRSRIELARELGIPGPLSP